MKTLRFALNLSRGKSNDTVRMCANVSKITDKLKCLQSLGIKTQ